MLKIIKYIYYITKLSYKLTMSETKTEFKELSKHTYMNLTEQFNQHKLNFIINHQDELKDGFRESCFYNNYDPFAIASKYLANSHLGKINVGYRQNNSVGRYYAMGSISLQSMPREIRHTISDDYIDIDMCNAHPVILAHLCAAKKIQIPSLKNYINNRDVLLEQLECDRDTAKTAILSIINGGRKAYKCLKNKPDWLIKFKKEIKKIHSKFAEEPEFELHEKKTNKEASYMNIKLCDFENKIITVIWKALGKPSDCVLCFDGIMIRSDDYDLRKLEAAVKKQLKIKINLVVKEMDHPLILGDVTPYEDPERLSVSEKANSKLESKLLKSSFTDGDVSDYVLAKYGDTMCYEGDFIYIWHDDTYWKRSDDGGVLINLLDTSVYKSVLEVLDMTLDRAHDYKQYMILLEHVNKFRNVNKQVVFAKAITLKMRHTQDEADMDAKPDLICFRNGVYDLDAGVFRKGRKDDYISQLVNYDYETSSPKEIDNLMVLIKQIMPHEDERECLLKALSSCLTARLVENVFIMTGTGRNGKDTLLTTLLSKALGKDLYYNNNTSVITEKNKGGISQERANMHKKRAVIYAEPAKTTPLICSTLKELTGCPELAGRGIYSKNTIIKNTATTIIQTNTIPRLDVVDIAIAKRLVIFPFRAMFYKQSDIDKLPLENRENVYEVNIYYKSQEFIEKNKKVFMNILINYFQGFKDDGYIIKTIPKTMEKLADGYMRESDDFTNWFYNEYEITDNKKEFIKVKDIYANYKISDLYKNLNKTEKRRENRAKLVSNIQETPGLKSHYLERANINGKTLKCIIVNHKIKANNDSDSDDDADDSDNDECVVL